MKDFAAVSLAILQSPAWRSLTGAQQNVYLAISHHRDKDGKAWPSVARIAELAGVTERSAQRTIQRLVALVLLIVDEGGGRKRTNIYTLPETPTPCASPFPAGKGDANSVTVSQQKTPARQHGKGDAQARKPRRLGVTRRDEEMKRHTPPPSKRAANPLWDAVVAAFQLRPVTTSDRSRVGRIVRDLGMKGATPDDVTLRLDRYRARWPDAAPTPEALLKHWDAFAAGNGYDNNPLHVHVEPDDADILAAAEDHARMEREAAARRNGES